MFPGVNCEINEDDCASNLCEFGECQDGINEYKCVCSPGYTGMFLTEKKCRLNELMFMLTSVLDADAHG